MIQSPSYFPFIREKKTLFDDEWREQDWLTDEHINYFVSRFFCFFHLIQTFLFLFFLSSSLILFFSSLFAVAFTSCSLSFTRTRKRRETRHILTYCQPIEENQLMYNQTQLVDFVSFCRRIKKKYILYVHTIMKRKCEGKRKSVKKVFML